MGVAVSPVPVIAYILMLLAPRAGPPARLSGSAGRSASSVTKLVLGLLLLLVAVRQWRSRPHGDEPAALPSWMSAIDRVTPAKAAGLGVLLSAVNPKNLLLSTRP